MKSFAVCYVRLPPITGLFNPDEMRHNKEQLAYAKRTACCEGEAHIESCGVLYSFDPK